MYRRDPTAVGVNTTPTPTQPHDPPPPLRGGVGWRGGGGVLNLAHEGVRAEPGRAGPVVK
jgi:hypothetical protein